MVRKLREGKEMPYVLWVLNGDTRQWEMYKGVNDAKQFIRDNDYDEFLDELNTQVFPNGTYYNNYIDWIVIPAGEEPRKFDTHKFYNSLKYESMRRNIHRGLDTVDESLTVNERHEFRHTLSDDPTGYERYVNYVECLVTACEVLTESAEMCLRRVEDNEEFYTDPKNERWYGFDEKMDQIAKVIQQIEKIKNKINTKM